MSDRRCPTCDQFKARVLFREARPGVLARDCLLCEEARARRAASLKAHHRHSPIEVGKPADPRFPGVDIDRIHYLRGAVRKKDASA